MTLNLPLPDLLAALVSGGAVLLGLVVGGRLLLQGRRDRARLFLGGFLVAAALSLTGELVGTLGLQRLHPHFWITPLQYTFALGPLLYLFVRTTLKPERGVGTRDLVHGVLPVAQAVLTWVTGFGSVEFKDAYWQSPFGSAYERLDTVVFALTFGGYLSAAWRTVRTSEGDPHTLKWLARLVAGSAGILIVAVLMDASLGLPPLVALVGDRAGAWLRLGEMLAYATLLYWVAFTGFARTLPRLPAPPGPRAETYGMDAAALKRHAARLQNLFEDEHLYLDPELTLGTLADRLGLAENETSYVLNAGLGTSYSDYVNGQRVAEAQRLLRETEDPILQVALAAGFASKPTFNRVFKQRTGLTPSQYRAQPRLSTS